ncbi:MAG TPA: AsmA family protein [Usitatibacter sp.]|nr:AsmA family protein [Usitatibacter sp.]
MGSWKKAAAWAAAAVTTVAVVGLVAVKLLVDPERLKQIARDKAKKAWSRDLQVGNITLELFPLPALLVHDVRLEHPTEPPIVAGSVIAEFELMPLLVGQTRYRNLYFKDATLQWEGVPWRVEQAMVETDPELRDVRINGTVWRNQRPVAVRARFEDFSKLGKPGALTSANVELEWHGAKLVASGRMPLDGTITHHALDVDLRAESLTDICAFWGLKRNPPAALNARFHARENEGRILIENLAASLGKLRVNGQVEYTPGPRPVTNLRLATEYLDWTRTYLDAGGEPAPPPKPPELFHDTPLAWWMLESLRGKEGRVDATFGTLVLRNGVVLRNLKLKAAYKDDNFDIASFTTDMLGGSATGRIQLDGGKKSVRFDFEGKELLLERWFKERGSTVPFSGGPMRVTAKLNASGNSMRQIVGGITGPMHIRMGRGVLSSPRAGEAEAKMTSAFSGKESREIEFECAAFALPFRGGRASGERLIGARTTASHLITSGAVDMRTQAVELKGRLRPKSGVGLATIAGDVKITGTVRQPRMSLDEAATPKAVARGAAALATLGLSVVGTAIADSQDARRNDPCEAVFR